MRYGCLCVLLGCVGTSQIAVCQVPAASVPCAEPKAILHGESGQRTTGIADLSERVVMLFTFNADSSHANGVAVVLLRHEPRATREADGPLRFPVVPSIPGHCHEHPWALYDGIVVQFAVAEQRVWVGEQEFSLVEGNVAAIQMTNGAAPSFTRAAVASIPSTMQCTAARCTNIQAAIRQALTESGSLSAFLR